MYNSLDPDLGPNFFKMSSAKDKIHHQQGKLVVLRGCASHRFNIHFYKTITFVFHLKIHYF